VGRQPTHAKHSGQKLNGQIPQRAELGSAGWVFSWSLPVGKRGNTEVTTVTWDCAEGHSVNQWWGLLLRGSCLCKRWTA